MNSTVKTTTPYVHRRHVSVLLAIDCALALISSLPSGFRWTERAAGKLRRSYTIMRKAVSFGLFEYQSVVDYLASANSILDTCQCQEAKDMMRHIERARVLLNEENERDPYPSFDSVARSTVGSTCHICSAANLVELARQWDASGVHRYASKDVLRGLLDVQRQLQTEYAFGVVNSEDIDIDVRCAIIAKLAELLDMPFYYDGGCTNDAVCEIWTSMANIREMLYIKGSRPNFVAVQEELMEHLEGQWECHELSDDDQ
jgi:hypothetical protein